MKLVDSHCHLNFPDFSNDLDETIQRARAAGVEYLLTVNTKLSEAKEIQHIAEKYPFIFCSAGVHPHDSMNHSAESLLSDLEELSKHPKVVAFGETGLDYHYNNSPKNNQIKSFELHLEAAKNQNLPVIIHTREADEDTIAVLNLYPGVRGVFHCFSGSHELAMKALNLGYYISFSGIITFKKADDLREIIKEVPLDRILVETDSPFLAPPPHRGKRNEPAYVKIVAETVADVLKMPIAEVAHQTTQNFFKLFNKASLNLN